MQAKYKECNGGKQIRQHLLLSIHSLCRFQNPHAWAANSWWPTYRKITCITSHWLMRLPEETVQCVPGQRTANSLWRSNRSRVFDILLAYKVQVTPTWQNRCQYAQTDETSQHLTYQARMPVWHPKFPILLTPHTYWVVPNDKSNSVSFEHPHPYRDWGSPNRNQVNSPKTLNNKLKKNKKTIHPMCSLQRWVFKLDLKMLREATNSRCTILVHCMHPATKVCSLHSSLATWFKLNLTSDKWITEYRLTWQRCQTCSKGVEIFLCYSMASTLITDTQNAVEIMTKKCTYLWKLWNFAGAHGWMTEWSGAVASEWN